MTTYIFPFGNGLATIVNPTVSITSVLDLVQTKKCTVNIVLEASGNQFALPVYGFSYETSWTKEEINTFVQTELLKYKLSDPA